VSEFRTCDAYDMAREIFEDDEIPPCFEVADRQVMGHWLCDACASALDFFCGLAKRVIAARNEP